MQKIREALVCLKRQYKITDFLSFDGNRKRNPLVYVFYIRRNRYRTYTLFSVEEDALKTQDIPALKVERGDNLEKLEGKILRILN